MEKSKITWIIWDTPWNPSSTPSNKTSYSLDQLQQLREEENQQQDEDQGQHPADELERHCQVGLQKLGILLEVLTSAVVFQILSKHQQPSISACGKPTSIAVYPQSYWKRLNKNMQKNM